MSCAISRRGHHASEWPVTPIDQSMLSLKALRPKSPSPDQAIPSSYPIPGIRQKEFQVDKIDSRGVTLRAPTHTNSIYDGELTSGYTSVNDDRLSDGYNSGKRHKGSILSLLHALDEWVPLNRMAPLGLLYDLADQHAQLRDIYLQHTVMARPANYFRVASASEICMPELEQKGHCNPPYPNGSVVAKELRQKVVNGAPHSV